MKRKYESKYTGRINLYEAPPSTPIPADYIRDLLPAKWGSGVGSRGSNPEPPMSALGQKRTFSRIQLMSALPPKADIAG